MNIALNDTLPPIGLMPRYAWDEKRIAEILNALARYALAGKPANIEWVQELEDLVYRREKKA